MLESVIGQGASGEVWRGHSRAGERLAFKLLRNELSHDPDTVTRFVKEREFLRSIQHENLVRLRDMVVEGQTLALVMNLVEGGDLKERLKAGQKFSAVDVCRLCAQIAHGLSAIHAAGIIHGDIKPANVLIEENRGWPTAKITDFSISRVAGSNESLVSGTPSYVAPELFNGEKPTFASDLYALGALTYELLVGVPPFQASSLDEVAALHAQATPDRAADVPDDVWAVVLRLLAKQPTQRPPDAAAVRAMFRNPKLAELTDSDRTVDGLYRPPRKAVRVAKKEGGSAHDGATRAITADSPRRSLRALKDHAGGGRIAEAGRGEAARAVRESDIADSDKAVGPTRVRQGRRLRWLLTGVGGACVGAVLAVRGFVNRAGELERAKLFGRPPDLYGDLILIAAGWIVFVMALGLLLRYMTDGGRVKNAASRTLFRALPQLKRSTWLVVLFSMGLSLGLIPIGMAMRGPEKFRIGICVDEAVRPVGCAQTDAKFQISSIESDPDRCDSTILLGKNGDFLCVTAEIRPWLEP